MHKYNEFGNTETLGTDIGNEVCYTGGINDKETGQLYLNARYYEPEDGRFVTLDTYRGEFEEPSSLHLYAYCDDPLNYIDPSGHDAVWLVAKKAIAGQGHAALLLKRKDGYWQYLSHADKLTDKKRKWGKVNSLKKVNKEFRGGKGKPYTSGYRFYGNHTKAIKEFRRAAKQGYNPVTNNCGQVACVAMQYKKNTFKTKNGKNNEDINKKFRKRFLIMQTFISPNQMTKNLKKFLKSYPNRYSKFS